MNVFARSSAWLRALASINQRISSLERTVKRMATQEQDLQNDLDTIKGEVVNVAGQLQSQADQIASLKAQLAAGTPVSQDQLEALHAEATAIASTLSGLAPAPVPAS